MVEDVGECFDDVTGGVTHERATALKRERLRVSGQLQVFQLCLWLFTRGSHRLVAIDSSVQGFVRFRTRRFEDSARGIRLVEFES